MEKLKKILKEVLSYLLNTKVTHLVQNVLRFAKKIKNDSTRFAPCGANGWSWGSENWYRGYPDIALPHGQVKLEIQLGALFTFLPG